MSNITHLLFGSFGLMMSPVWKKGWGRNWFIATVTVATVAVGATALGSQIIGTGTGGGGGGAGTANVWVDTNGGTCTRSATLVAYSDAAACSNFNPAYSAASSGDIVRVVGGAYSPTVPAEGANKITPAGKSDPDIQFLCDSGNVTQLAPGTQFVITGPHVTIQGSCFKFNKIWVGDGANGVSVDDVTIDGVSMMIFDISGSSNVTIKNSKVGPMIACFGPGNGATSCQDNTATNEKYFFDNGYPNTQYNEPKIHSGGNTGAVPPTNVTLLNNMFDTMQSRDANTLHTGCLWTGWGGTTNNIVIDGNKFQRCAVYDIHIDAGGASQTIQNNWFGYPVEPLANTSQVGFDTETTPGFTDIQCKSGVCDPTNFLIRFNTFSHGIDMNYGGAGTSATNVRLIGNILGSNSNCGFGQTANFNITNSGTCGTNSSAATTSSQVTTYSYPFDFHLIGAVGSKTADNYVTPTGADYTLTTDIDGQARTAGSRDAGADER